MPGLCQVNNTLLEPTYDIYPCKYLGQYHLWFYPQFHDRVIQMYQERDT